MFTGSNIDLENERFDMTQNRINIEGDGNGMQIR
jgi:hypothetical protein